MLVRIIPTHVYQVRTVDLGLGIDTSRAFAGSPLYVHSRGPRRIPSLVVEIPWIAVATTVMAGKYTVD